jgi:hypothetical protein
VINLAAFARRHPALLYCVFVMHGGKAGPFLWQIIDASELRAAN